MSLKVNFFLFLLRKVLAKSEKITEIKAMSLSEKEKKRKAVSLPLESTYDSNYRTVNVDSRIEC